MADQKTERMSEKRRPKEFSLSSPFFSSCSILPARHGLLESRVPSTMNCPGFPLPRCSLESASSLLESALSVDASTQMDTDLPGKGHDTRKKRRPFFFFLFFFDDRFTKTVELIRASFATRAGALPTSRSPIPLPFCASSSPLSALLTETYLPRRSVASVDRRDKTSGKERNIFL